MSRSLRSLPRRSLAAGLLLVLAVLGGCSRHHGVTAPPASRAQPPTPSSPEAAVRLFEWSWNHRDTLGVFQLLADDFRFNFAAWDSAGNLFPGRLIGRQEMLCIVRHIFRGGGCYPPANSIVLSFDPSLYPQGDSRPGKDAIWHREILTSVYLNVRTESASYIAQGNARFFVVRGDSALIPQELVSRGFRPDSTRWYVDQWNDETRVGSALSRAFPVSALPSRGTTWGDILALYR